MDLVICDHQRLFCDAFAMLLTTQGWNVVGIASDPAQVLALLASNHVDVCIMDLTFPEGTTGIAGIASVRATSPDTKVVVLTATSDPLLVVRAVEAGAHTILFKDDDIDHVIQIIERAYGGDARSVPSPRRPETVANEARHIDTLNSFLTREHEVLPRLAQGQSGKHLALQMGVSYATARTRIQNVLAKLGVHSSLEAVAFAIQHVLYRRHERLP
jgi:two-component system nitrate/nitrite response regulator NarL